MNVFSEVGKGLPAGGKEEFSIKVLVWAEPISRGSYRLALTDLEIEDILGRNIEK